MKLRQYPAPHIRHQESNLTLMSDMLLLLMVLTGMACFFYGMRAAIVCGVSVAAAAICDILCTLLRCRRPNPRDFSPLVTGLIVALAMPATIPFHIVASASVFAICIVKHPFGGTGNNLFNPAAGGISFAMVCWPQQMFLYPMPFERIPVMGTFSDKLLAFTFSSGTGLNAQELIVRLYQNPTYVLRGQGPIPSNDLLEMLLGNCPGPMGATNILVLISCLAFLLFRGTVRWQLVCPYLLVCTGLLWLFPRSAATGILPLAYELMSGMLLYCAILLFTDPATSPKRGSSAALYGCFAAVVTVLFRYYGGYEESVPFAVLFSNAFVPVIDRYNEALHRLLRRKRFEYKKTKKPQEA